MIISLDTETTGVDFVHGAMPFLVTSWDGENPIRFWEWDVDPLTREPCIPVEDIEAIAELVDAADLIYLQGAKFDARALDAIGVTLPWHKVRDTIVASHILATNHKHDLTSLVDEYLWTKIQPLEDKVKEVVQACRTIAKRDYPNWKLAAEDQDGMPSVKPSSKRDEDKPWKNDMWLPRALGKDAAVFAALPDGWDTACSDYANGDSEHTLPLGIELERRLQEGGWWRIYEHRLRLPQCAYEMECFGISARGEFVEWTMLEYQEHVADAECALHSISRGYGHDLELAEGAALNDNMRDLFYGSQRKTCPRCGLQKRVKHWNGEGQAPWLKDQPDYCPKCAKGNTRRRAVSQQLIFSSRPNMSLPVILKAKTGNACMDKEAMGQYIQTLKDGPALDFMVILSDKRAYDTALTYMESYKRYWVPVERWPGFYRIHPSLNPCGTDHLRWASNSPNMQNVSGESKEISNRPCFGPLPDREWWRMDFRSIENRIPAYESGEPKMVEVFERPDDKPYWGSLYYLTASVLYPHEFWPLAEYPMDDPRGFKKAQPRLYKRAKFFNLARLYGAQKKKGDLLSGIPGSCDMVDSALPLLAALQAKYLRDAELIGYVETLPDRTVDPEHGYPILASRTEDGRVLSTTPFNYHTSGTACWCKNTALVRCVDQCAEWRAEGFDAHVALEVHDDILFDFPRGASMEENLPLAMMLKAHMERAGTDLIPSIPTPVSVEYITESWADGIAVQ